VLRDLLRQVRRRRRDPVSGEALPGATQVGLGRSVEPHSAAPGGRLMTALERMAGQGRPAIVVPIYNAPVEVNACISALLRFTPGECRIILMEDASLDPLVDEVLAKYQDRPNIEVHRNECNVGFSRSVNRGIEIAGRSDVVLLNSDTEVTPRWLENLRLAAYSGERVATATPLSNNAGAFSAPVPGKHNPPPDWLAFPDYARLVTQVSERVYPSVPTGSGFCIYMRRDCIDRIGSFDAEAFPRGYGEENDFCMRAARDGWTHVIDDATLIYHVRSASFGDARKDLLRAGRAVLDGRYPDYTGLVRRFEKNVELQRVRDRIGRALAASHASRAAVKPRILTVAGAADDPQSLPGWEPLSLAYRPGLIELFVRGDAGEAPRLVERAALPPGSEAMPGPNNGVAGVLADWLVYYAIERARFSEADRYAQSLRAVCEKLNIPVEPA
jgi:O-antigen biosynthesis protein